MPYFIVYSFFLPVDEQQKFLTIFLVFFCHSQDQKDVIYLYIICHKSLLTQIWHPHLYHSEMWFPQKFSSTSKQIYQNVLDSYLLIIRNRRRQPSKQCTVSRLVPNDSKSSSRNQRIHQNHTRYEKLKTQTMMLKNRFSRFVEYY